MTECLDALREAKDQAYRERNLLVAFVTRVYPSHLMRHPAADTPWEDDWRWIVCVHSPTGQMTWHIHDDDVGLFEPLVMEGELPGHWDGHTTADKYERLACLPVGMGDQCPEKE